MVPALQVTDFGTSFKASQRNEGGLPLMGTANYMAPEARGGCPGLGLRRPKPCPGVLSKGR